MSNKPVYVPAHKRKRFHGAFTGGFSAGYFNTVGSKEGWKPREDVGGGQEQNAQDYMDDQDHDEWGGPTSVKREYVVTDEQKKPAALSLDWSVIQPPRNVGTRLLRVLGWREGSTAYVPANSKDESSAGKDDEETAILSKKRLRKIQLQQTLVRIPPPKLDAGGLGYDVYRDAPEFQAHRDKRRREAHQRTRAATETGGSNAYRLSNLQDDDDGVPSKNEKEQTAPADSDDPYLSYETVQEFVGTKTAGGFAIREDMDDVYDENPLQTSSLHINKDEYDTEIYEHESDDEGTDNKKPSLGGMLSSWATGDSKTSDRGVTSDGRPPLPGFCLGGATSEADIKRYPGPEVPSTYVLKRHVFRDDEHPVKIQQIAQQEKVEQQRQQAFKRITDPMAGVTFLGLAAAMKSRFTAAAPVTKEDDAPTPVGLYRPVAAAKPEGASDEPEKKVDKEIKIETTFMLFYPELLVCKRLGVTPPTHSKNRITDQKQTAESTFFEQEVMKQAAGAKPEVSTGKSAKESMLNGEHDIEPNATDQRPAMDVYKAIYEPKSESEADDDEVETADEPGPATGGTDKSTFDQAIVLATSASIVPAPAVQNDTMVEQDDEIEDKRRQKKRKRRKREEQKRRRERSPSASSSDSDLDESSSDEEEERRKRRKEKKRRRHKEEKKKRKKHKSSRRYED